MEIYKDTIYSRYFIFREGIFKNTKKILNISKDYLMIESFDSKFSREIIRYEDIINVINSESNLKDFTINYYIKHKNNSDGIESNQQFTTHLRTQVVCEILKQIDLYTKVNHYPVETFKSYLFFDDIEDVLTNLKQEGKNLNKPFLNPNILEINLNIYRSTIEWVAFDSKRETRIRISDIEKMKIHNINDSSILKIETFNKIDLFFVPKRIEELKVIVDKIIDNAKNFLNLNLILENIDRKDIQKNPDIPKMKVFSFKTNRILYNSTKRFIKLTGDKKFIYEIYENEDKTIDKINKIPINEIIYIISYENELEFFEIVLKSSARYLYQTIDPERNIIVTNIINLISNCDNKSANFLVLCNKPKYGLRVMGFLSDEIDSDYEKNISENFNNFINEIPLRNNIIEEICLNFCFQSSLTKIETIISNKKISQELFEIVTIELENLKKLNSEENKVEFGKKLYLINIFLIFYKIILSKFNNDKLITDLSKILKTDIGYHTIFYNVMNIFKLLIPKETKQTRRDDIAKKKWIISLHLEYGVKFKWILYSKVFEKNLINNDNFENQNIMHIYMILEVLKNIYESSKEINLINEILSKFTGFDFLYTLYLLFKSTSKLLVITSLETLINLWKNLTYEFELSLKQLILGKTLIFPLLIKLYIINHNDLIGALSIKFLKSFLISHTEATNILKNLFPATLFYYIDKNKPNPINWLDHEWDSFFKNLIKDYSTTQLIWNENCRIELINYIDNLIKDYEQFSQNSNLIECLNYEETIDTSILPLKTSFNSVYYYVNYREMSLDYSCLKRYYFVWKYYLKKILNEKGRPSLHSIIEKPKKFWKKVINELIYVTDEWKIILLIKCLTILYKMHFETIGVIKNLDFFINLFNSSTHDQKIYLIQLFFVICDVHDRDIKLTNIKTFINMSGTQILIDFIPDLLKIDYLIESLEKFSFDEIVKDIVINDQVLNIPINESFLDQKETTIKVIKQDNMYFDKQFSNYTNYANINSSWENANKDIKTCTLVIRLIKIFLKRFSLMTETDNKIMYPIPKIKYILMDENNFSKLFTILFCKDENICIEFIDLIISYMSDPFSFQTIISKTNITDLLIFYMLKYRSKAIMNFFEQIYNYNNIFFNFDCFLKTLNDDEFRFVNLYETANKYLLKYLPVNLIYYYYTTDFQDFIKKVFSDNIFNSDLIWNHDMLRFLINSLHDKFSLFLKSNLKDYYLKYVNVDKKFHEGYNEFPVLKYDESFRIEYEDIRIRVKGFIYFLDIYVSKTVKKINSDKGIDKKYTHIESNNLAENHIEILLRIILLKIIKQKEFLENQTEFYSHELRIYFKSFLKIVERHDLNYDAFMQNFIETYNYLLERDSCSENEQKILKIILKIIFVSVANMEIKSIYNEKLSSQHFYLLMKGLIFFFKKFFSQNQNEYLEKTKTNLIKIITSMIQVINRVPEIINSQENDDNNLDIMGDYIHKYLFNEVLLKLMKKETLEKMVALSYQLLLCIFELIYSLSKIYKSTIFLIKNGIILEMILFTFFFDKKKKITNDLKNSLARKAMIIINSLVSFTVKVKEDKIKVLRIDIKSLCKDFYDAVFHIYGYHLMSFLIDKVNFNEKKTSLSTSFDYDDQIMIFLNSVKRNFEIPDFVWDKKLRKEIKLNLIDFLNRITNGDNIDYLTELKELKFKSFEAEFKIDNIYINLYNKEPQWKIRDSDLFLEKIKQIFLNNNENISQISSELNNKNLEMILAMKNCIKYSKASEKILTNDKNFAEKLITILKNTDSQQTTATILSFLYIFSQKDESMKLLLNSRIFFIIINILTKYVCRETIEPIINILINVVKNDEYIEKLNLIIFLFLMNCVVTLKERVELNEINMTRLEILKIIKKFLLNNKIGSVINRLLEFYYPQKIIDNLFGAKGINISLIWLDNELELPDLIWNQEAMNQSKKLIFDDCFFFLQHEANIDGFPQNLIDHKLDQLDPHKCFFFEIVDEFKIDNIYLRIFNKDPSYNINRSLILFLKQVINQTLNSLRYFSICNFINQKYYELNRIPSSKSVIISKDQIFHFLKTFKDQFTVCLTATLLIIEQINFNDYNENLIVSSSEDMKNLLQEDQEKNLIDLVKRSFDYQKLLNLNLIKKIVSLHEIFLNDFLEIFDNPIRLLYLQIIYLLTNNKNGITIISNIGYIKVLEKLYEEESIIGDYEFVIALVTYYRLIFHDIMNISGFLTNCLDKYVDLTNKRPTLLKYLQLIVARILNDSQYADSIVYKIKNEAYKYRNLSISLASKLASFESQYLNVWRKAPENKEMVEIIYKTNHVNNFIDDNAIASIGVINVFESKFPIFPKTSISYFNIKYLNYNIQKLFDLSQNAPLMNLLKYLDCFIEAHN